MMATFTSLVQNFYDIHCRHTKESTVARQGSPSATWSTSSISRRCSIFVECEPATKNRNIEDFRRPEIFYL